MFNLLTYFASYTKVIRVAKKNYFPSSQKKLLWFHSIIWVLVFYKLTHKTHISFLFPYTIHCIHSFCLLPSAGEEPFYHFLFSTNHRHHFVHIRNNSPGFSHIFCTTAILCLVGIHPTTLCLQNELLLIVLLASSYECILFFFFF